MRRSLIVMLMAGLIAPGCRQDPAAVKGPEAPSPAVLGTDRPFHAEVEGLGMFPPRPEGRCRTMVPVFLSVLTGTGQATHLGAVKWSSSHCAQLPTSAPPPYALFERGEGTLTAANGDQLNIRFEGTQDTPVVDPILGTWRITFVGGTGRFASASGSAAVAFRIGVRPTGTPWPFRIVMDGRVSY